MNEIFLSLWATHVTNTLLKALSALATFSENVITAIAYRDKFLSEFLGIKLQGLEYKIRKIFCILPTKAVVFRS